METTVNPLGAAAADLEDDLEMAGMFAQYAAEFSEVAAEATGKLSRAKSYSDDSTVDKGNLLKDAESLVKQACDLMKQIDIEVRSTEPAQRRVLTDRVKPLREKLRFLQEDYRSASDDSDRDGLFSGAGGSDGQGGLLSGGSRSRMTDANQRMSKQTEMIRRAVETAEETESVALDITGELTRNRETIMGVRSHLSDTSGALGTARNLISSMQKRECQQKVILGFVAMVLIGAIALVIYYASH